MRKTHGFFGYYWSRVHGYSDDVIAAQQVLLISDLLLPFKFAMRLYFYDCKIICLCFKHVLSTSARYYQYFKN